MNISGGTTPYTIKWSDLTGLNQPQNRTNIPVGTYRVTVTDARTCDTMIQNIIVIFGYILLLSMAYLFQIQNKL